MSIFGVFDAPEVFELYCLDMFGYSSCLVCPDNKVEPWHDLDPSGILITNVLGMGLGG